MKNLLARLFCLILLCSCTLPILSGCGTAKINFYLNDEIIYTTEAKVGSTYAVDYEFDESAYQFENEYDASGNKINKWTFQQWVDQKGVAMNKTFTVEGDVNIYADVLPTVTLVLSGSVFYTGNKIFMKVVAEELEGWSFSIDHWTTAYSGIPPVEITPRLDTAIKGYDLYLTQSGCSNTFTVTYSNGAKSVEAKHDLYFNHWRWPLSLYLLPGEPTTDRTADVYEGKELINQCTVPLNGNFAFEDVRLVYKNQRVFRDVFIKEVVIDDPSIVSFDAESKSLNGLKAGTTKITVYGKWFDIEWDSYSNIQYRTDGSGLIMYERPGHGSAGLKREITVTVA